MSELKAFNCVESDLQEFCEPRLVYLKDDVDKVIARCKYKRCLAMAEMCVDLCNARWHKRWLAIAEKFKQKKVI